jgi:hypothetical protein
MAKVIMLKARRFSCKKMSWVGSSMGGRQGEQSEDCLCHCHEMCSNKSTHNVTCVVELPLQYGC